MHLWCTAELPHLETRRFLSGGPLLRSESFPASSISEPNHVEARGSSKHHLVSLAAVRSRLRVRHFWMSSMRIMFARVCPITSPWKMMAQGLQQGCSRLWHSSSSLTWHDLTMAMFHFEIEICCPQLVQFNQQPVTQHLPFSHFSLKAIVGKFARKKLASKVYQNWRILGNGIHGRQCILFVCSRCSVLSYLSWKC